MTGMEKKGWWSGFLYYTVFGMSYLLSLLPFKVLYFLSDGLYWVVYFLVRYRRDVVRDNLRQSFPEKTLDEVVSIEKKFYHFFCDYIFETLKLTSISKKSMRKHMRFHGMEELEDCFWKEKRSFVFLYMGHYCNWEWVALLSSCISPSIHGYQIYHPIYNKVIDRFFLYLRNQFGGESIPMKNTLGRIVELKKEGTLAMVGFISDQLPKWNSMHFFVPFLHRETAVFTGAEQIGRKVGAAYFFVEMSRPKRGYYDCTFKRMEYPPQSETEYDMTALFMRKLEIMIRRAPQYWLWTHKRWKRTKEEWLERQRSASVGNVIKQ